MVQLIESIPDFDAVIASNKLVVVDFYAEWCGPCRLIAPFIEQLNKDTEDVVFIKVDVDILHVSNTLTY
jgi:thioredoxin 1